MKKLFVLFCIFASLSVCSQNLRRSFVDSLLNGVEIRKDIRYNIIGHPLLLDIYYPPKVDNESLPCVVWIHGGALTDTTIQKDYDLIRWGITRMVQNGYICVSINYRLITESPLPTAIQDCETAIRFLKSNAVRFKLDPNRIAVVGESAGGYLAGFCSFACNTNIFKTEEWDKVSNNITCGVLWYPAINHVPYNMIDYISPDDIPVIAIHGDADHIVSIEQSYQIQEKCKEKGIDFRLYTITGAGHGFFDQDWKFNKNNMGKAIDITLHFLNEQLKNKNP